MRVKKTRKFQRNLSTSPLTKSMMFFGFIKKFYPLLLCFVFFVAYSVLTVVRHNNYQSFGFDLGINDQVVWEYSRFKAPITSIDHVPFIPKLYVHIEIVYALLAPFYWLWTDARMLLILEAAFVCFSGLAIYLLAKHYKLHPWAQGALLFNYLMFYGVQNALWFDVHSSTFAASFVAWFLYFLVTKNTKWAIIFFVLAITAKENVAGITLLICVVHYIVTRSKVPIYFGIASLAYLAFVFGVYFPYIAGGYRFANSGGLFSKLDPTLMVNTVEKRDVYLYSFLSYGFIPFLSPLYLIPVVGNLASYFVLGSSVSGAQGLFGQYRIGLVPLMSWATIVSIARFKWLNTKYIAVYLVLCALVVQYQLHLPLSYLTKKTFWTQPQAVRNIDSLIVSIPENASLVSQNNIIPHVNYRDNILTLWPIKKDFSKNSPCRQPTCDWFRWVDNPQYLVVDTSEDWDARHLLVDRGDYIKGLENMERAGIIKRYKQIGNAVLYNVLAKPNE
jgi:uncharacterized membrane protein